MLLILGCNSFAVNLKPRTHGHHQILHFLFSDALQDLYSSYPSVANYLRISLFLVLSWVTDQHELMIWDQMTDLVIQFHCLKKLWLLLQKALDHYNLYCESLPDQFSSIFQILSKLWPWTLQISCGYFNQQAHRH